MPEPQLYVLSSAGPRAVPADAPQAEDRAPSPDGMVIGEAERTAIDAAVAQARSLADRNTSAEHPHPVHVRLPMDHRAAISFERHAAGLYRHLWIYVETPGSLPSMSSIRLIAQEFGFDLAATIERHTWMEQLAPEHHAVNILEMHLRTPRSAA